MIDLHIHSTYSDGTYSPAEIVQMAEEKGLYAIALTDHDTVEGISTLYTAAINSHVKVIPGVEVSVTWPEVNIDAGDNGGSMHILGYFPDGITASHSAFTQLKEIQDARARRNPQIIQKLQDCGCDITYEEVCDIAGGTVIGRPHIATVLCQKSYATSMDDAFNRYLKKGAAAYVHRNIMTDEKAIDMIHHAGGIAVLAHPDSISVKHMDELESIIKRLAGYGLDGIEVLYTSYTQYENNAYKTYAEKYNLYTTGGTDFHGENKKDIHLGTGFGNLHVPDEWYDILYSGINTETEKENNSVTDKILIDIL